MGRWAYLDTDEERLPHGIKRIGYDADDQEYTFFDTSDGSLWVGRYGPRTCVSRPKQVVSARDEHEIDFGPEYAPRGELKEGLTYNPFDLPPQTDPEPSSSPSTRALLSTFTAVGRLARLIVARRGSNADRRSPREERRRSRRVRERAKGELSDDEKRLDDKGSYGKSSYDRDSCGKNSYDKEFD
ncbi:hypothetical protein F5Y11DRAFT_353462 [Daldinia sp. FL1419]|nr:hypothetical protein F5Y11DRAFT_353462 [Daldinia sp. FL1419]